MAPEPAATVDHADPMGSVAVLHEELAHVQPHPEVSHTEHGLTYIVAGAFRMLQRGPIEAGPGTVTVVPSRRPPYAA